jgi:hypothetical protein
MPMSGEQSKKRARVDSIIQGVISDSHGFKRMKVGHDSTWAKIDNVIGKSSAQLVLIEVPKNVSHLLAY